ncbi:hypothetical protein V1514DRAFT_65167 [Lipomyces japonicus]|uniref:uncharacterized protein n=1 Tax=Lipomyces japonicus TaxID=56871 RepID=UPI0034CD5AB7
MRALCLELKQLSGTLRTHQTLRFCSRICQQFAATRHASIRCEPPVRRPFSSTIRVEQARPHARPYSTDVRDFFKSEDVVPLSGFVDLSPRRGLIEVTGPDAKRFLHGLLTNEPPEGPDGVYAVFLNVKGRILYDVFIYPTLHNPKWVKTNASADSDAQTYLIECDNLIADKLLKYMTFRKLRDKVNIKKRNDWKVWFAWEDDIQNLQDRQAAHQPTELDLFPFLVKTPNFIGADDTRAPGFGVRMVLSNDAESPLWPLRVYEEGRVENFVKSDLHTYDIRRIEYGIPEGLDDFKPDDLLPMETCIDMMGGINFSKGCYVGQELTTRAKRVGITRKRLLPYSLYDLQSETPPESIQYLTGFTLPLNQIIEYRSPIVAAGDKPKLNSRGEVARSIGRIISIKNNIGLAIVSMDWIEKGPFAERSRVVPHTENGDLFLKDADNADEHKGIGIRFFKPYWWQDAEGVHNNLKSAEETD